MNIAEKYSPEFAHCVKITLEKEGVFSDISSDRGGATKYGISQRFLNGINYSKQAKDLTKEEAIELYYNHFWLESSSDKLPLGIALMVFDYAVNSGNSKAKKDLQRAISYEYGVDLKIDGVIGAITIKELNKLISRSSGRLALIQCYSTLRGQLFLGVIEKDTSQGVFFRGWLRRLFELTEMAGNIK